MEKAARLDVLVNHQEILIYKGVLDRLTNIVHLYQKPTRRGAKADVIEVPLSEEDKLEELIDDDELFEKLMEVSAS